MVSFSIFRFLSTLNYSVPLATNATVSKDECREFMAVFPGNSYRFFCFYCGLLKLSISFADRAFFLEFPDLVRDLTERAKKYGDKDASKWLARVSFFCCCHDPILGFNFFFWERNFGEQTNFWQKIRNIKPKKYFFKLDLFRIFRPIPSGTEGRE